MSFMNSLQNAGQGGKDFGPSEWEWYGASDGEPPRLFRFITGLDTMKVYQCPNDQFVGEVAEFQWKADTESGTPHKCQKCGNAITDENVIWERPSAQEYMRHRFWNNTSRTGFSTVCQGEGCPACAQDNKAKKIGVLIAIEYEKEYGDTVVNEFGAPTRPITSVKPLQNEHGGLKMICFNQPIFFYKPLEVLQINEGRIDHVLFEVERMGSGTQTRYSMTRDGDPSIEPLENYKEQLERVMESVTNMHVHMSTPDWYRKKGLMPMGTFQPSAEGSQVPFPVAEQQTPANTTGFVAPANDPNVGAAPVTTNAPQGNAVSWNEAQNQLNSYFG